MATAHDVPVVPFSKELSVQHTHRLVVLPLLFLATAGLAACGDDAEQKPATTEVMTEKTEVMTEKTEVMTESTEAMMTDTTEVMTESTEAMMTDTTGG
ncbi:MAG: hypothetical protein WCC60_05850 [Ilumatobacteraceae bacterium]